ncbi:hypothetical protein BGZ47_000560 [Haplosporangium gracile]|nr:hypothetical protein BGZ47_000560 [Haplosporangium gracile]
MSIRWNSPLAQVIALGLKWTIFLACATYVLYAGSLLCYNHTKNGAFTITAGGLLGAIFNAGAVLGSVIAYAINNKVVVAQSLGDAAYIVFISLMAIGTLIALSLCSSTSAAHSNGDKIQIQTYSTWIGEVVAIGDSWSFARVLDYQSVNRKTRLIIITACFVATWIEGIIFQKGCTISSPKGSHDYTEGASYYIQSSGAAIAWKVNASGTPHMTELIICFALLIAALPGAFFLTMRIKDYSDEPIPEHDMHKDDGKHEIIA